MTARTSTPRHLAPRPAGRTSRRLAAIAAAFVIAASLGGASTGISSAAYTDRAAATTTATAQAPTCTDSITSTSTDVLAQRGTFLFGWGRWADNAWLCSPTHRWVAGLQVDGNLVAYDMASTPGKALWNSWTFGPHVGGQATSLLLRTNGELAVLGAAGQTLRSSGTAGVPTPVVVRIDDTGVLTLTDANGAVRYTTAGAEHLNCNTTAYLACDPSTVKAAS